MTFEERKKLNTDQRTIINEKLAQGLPLTIEERYFMCSNFTLKACYETPGCQEEYYDRIYLLKEENAHKFLQISGVDRNRFRKLVRDWEGIIAQDGQPDEILQASVKETREEIRVLKREYSFPLRPKLQEQYDERYFELLAWSKFRTILVRKIFDLSIKTPYFALHLGGQEIRFDAFSYMHILTRHFAHGMKQYRSEKDHFYDVFQHTDLHLRIERLFAKIDAAGILHAEPIEELTFRYGGRLYRIYIQPQIKYEQGRSGPQSFLRLTTFFPLSDQRMLTRLATEYKEMPVDDLLSVFVRIDAATTSTGQINQDQQ